MCFVDGIAFSDFELWAALIRSDQLPQQEVPRFFKPILSSPVGIVSSTCHSSTSCPTEPTKLPDRPATAASAATRCALPLFASEISFQAAAPFRHDSQRALASAGALLL
jgi:hypothetical protein